MDCQQIQAFIEDGTVESLSDDVHEMVWLHVPGCASCRRVAREVHILARLGRIAREEPRLGTDFNNAIWKRVAALENGAGLAAAETAPSPPAPLAGGVAQAPAQPTQPSQPPPAPTPAPLPGPGSIPPVERKSQSGRLVKPLAPSARLHKPTAIHGSRSSDDLLPPVGRGTIRVKTWHLGVGAALAAVLLVAVLWQFLRTPEPPATTPATTAEKEQPADPQPDTPNPDSEGTPPDSRLVEGERRFPDPPRRQQPSPDLTPETEEGPTPESPADPLVAEGGPPGGSSGTNPVTPQPEGVPTPEPSPGSQPRTEPEQIFLVEKGQARILASASSQAAYVGPGKHLLPQANIVAEEDLRLVGVDVSLHFQKGSSFELGRTEETLKLKGGKLFCTVIDSSFQVTTEDVAVEVGRGSVSQLTLDSDQTLQLAVLEGELQVEAGKRRIDVLKEEACRIRSGEPPRKGTVQDPLVVGAWRHGLLEEIPKSRLIALWNFKSNKGSWEGCEFAATSVPGGGSGCVRFSGRDKFSGGVGSKEYPFELPGPMRLRFRYYLTEGSTLTVGAWNQTQDGDFTLAVENPPVGRWVLFDEPVTALTCGDSQSTWAATDLLGTLRFSGKGNVLIDEVTFYRGH